MKSFYKQAAKLMPLLPILLVLMLEAGALGQDARLTFINRQREIENQLQIDMTPLPAADQPFALDWGGWFTVSGQWFHDNGTITLFPTPAIVQSVRERHLMEYDLRLWGRVAFSRYAEIYARMRLGYVDWGQNDTLEPQDHYWDGPNLDRGWVSFDLRKAWEQWKGERLGWNLNTKIGRQYLEVGTGLVLSLPVDAAVLGMQLGDLRLRGLAARSVSSFDNIDRSAPVAERLKRDFFGGELEYLGFKRHRPFAYALRAVDRTETPRGLIPDQRYGYDSWYFGVGSRGTLWSAKWAYTTEFIWQMGEGYADRLTGPTNQLEDIEAYAADAQINYYFGGDHKPKFSAQYTFASGDDDRPRPSDTVGGNLWGSNDYGFNAFGFRYTGYSFAPVITNIHVLRLGFAFLPLPNNELFKQLEIGADVFGYASAQSGGGVSDASAVPGTRHLGSEADAHIYWRMASDLSLIIRYGVFFPGEAFLDRSGRQSLFGGVTLSF